MGVKSAAEFTALDEQTLLRRHNCGKKTAAEIMEVVRRYKPSIEVAFGKTDVISLTPAQGDVPVSHLRLSVRATNVLERLKISTVGQLAGVSDLGLLNVKNFGKQSLREVRLKVASFISTGFVFWPAKEQTGGQPSRHITRVARKLQRLRNAKAVLRDDPRFGHLVHEMGLEAKNARQAADMIATRKVDPVNPQPLNRRLSDLFRAIQAAGRVSLEAELWSLTDGLGSDRNRQIIVSRLGWDGRPPRTLESVGQRYGITRERVRQICTRIEAVQKSKPFLPVLDRILKIAAAAAPTLADELEKELVRRSLTRATFDLDTLVEVAHGFGRKTNFTIEALHGRRVIVPSTRSNLFEQIHETATATVRHWGVANVEDLAAATNTSSAVVRQLLPFVPTFKWLDESSGWFWIADVPRNSLLTSIRKILAVSPVIDVGELRAGVGRPHRRKGFAPPRRVLLELCRQLPWCRVNGNRVTAAQPLDPVEILSDSERTIFRVMKEHGPVMPKSRFEELCLASGINWHSFWIYLTYCPIITRYAPSVYGLRGADIPAGLVETLTPKRAGKWKVLVDYGWTKDRNLRVFYRISKGMLSNGIVSIPAALKPFLQGKFALMTVDKSAVGALVVRDNCAWGLGPFFSRRGGEPGDYLSVLFDLSRRVAVVEIGDVSLADQFQPSQMSVRTDGNQETERTGSRLNI
jgi:hypothetical protein